MAARKPKVEFYWSRQRCTNEQQEAHVAAGGDKRETWGNYVNWRLVGANGEIVCQSTQGSRDKADALRNMNTAAKLLYGATTFEPPTARTNIVGPGKKPT